MIDKIKKLLALAHDKGATEEEASNALAMANRLMLKHGIDQGQLDKEDEIVGATNLMHGGVTRWQGWCALAAGQLYNAQAISRGDKAIYFVGREENREAAMMTYTFIIDQINLLYRLSLPKGLSKKDRAQYRRDFKEACALRVTGRIEKIIANMKTDEGAKTIGSTALVVIDHSKKLEEEINDFLGGRTRQRKSRLLSRKITEAAIRGNIAGEAVKINYDID